jgi:hypothetical protein
LYGDLAGVLTQLVPQRSVGLWIYSEQLFQWLRVGSGMACSTLA